MVGSIRTNFNLFCVVFGLFSCFLLLCGCGGAGVGDDGFSENIYGFELNYAGNTQLERVLLSEDDLDEIVDLFQEVGDNIGYRDSLLVAVNYAHGLGINAFAQDNLDTLESQGLTLSNVQKHQIGLYKNGKKIDCVLVEYEITQGLVSEIPLLYVSELFVPRGDDILFMSFITEDRASHLSAMDMFKNIN